MIYKRPGFGPKAGLPFDGETLSSFWIGRSGGPRWSSARHDRLHRRRLRVAVVCAIRLCRFANEMGDGIGSRGARSGSPGRSGHGRIGSAHYQRHPIV